MSYRPFFGLTREPFTPDIELDAILQTPELLAVNERVGYVIRIGGIGLLTGEVGSGKSTALRWSTGKLHPATHKVLWVTATAGSMSLPNCIP